MNWGSAVMLSTLLVLAGCGNDSRNYSARGEAMKLTIRWQRLVNEEGETCDRCGGTEEEVRRAVKDLSASLGPLGIRVVLREETLSPQEFAAEPGESNRIWVDDRPLEVWLEGEVGMSECAFCCAEVEGATDCRTLSVDGRTYEVIPAQLIVRAGLLAASRMMQHADDEGCCPASEKEVAQDQGCCPAPAQDDLTPAGE